MADTSVGLLGATTVWWTPTCGHSHTREVGPITYECPDDSEHEHDEGGA